MSLSIQGQLDVPSWRPGEAEQLIPATSASRLPCALHKAPRHPHLAVFARVLLSSFWQVSPLLRRGGQTG